MSCSQLHNILSRDSLNSVISDIVSSSKSLAVNIEMTWCLPSKQLLRDISSNVRVKNGNVSNTWK